MHSCIITTLVRNVNKKSEQAAPPASSGHVRQAQRNRTRKAIVDAAMQLLDAGGTPSVSEVANAAQVSRRTVYMYFPTLEQLLIDATLGALSRGKIDPVVTESTSDDPVARVRQLSKAINTHSSESMHLGRALIRLTVEGDEPLAGGPRRGFRRVQWIEQALAPARKALSKHEFEKLVSALSVLIGWEPMIALKDVRGLGPKEADEVLTFAVTAVVEKALNDARKRNTT
jgi:AcrR family transcriptional regulator